ncbi:MAG: IS66 family insertion sequence element accessory protein TnpB [Phycisphaeraceae bacterium]|nr:IS66 family insertion sequence element accessory protein TnpB [Phycisphaeraceae bacterium]
MGRFERDMDKEAFWRLAFSEQQSSGLSVRAFCVREGLKENNFYAWRRQLARRDGPEPVAEASSRFVEVTLPEVALAVPLVVVSDEMASALELVLPGGVVVRVPDRIDAMGLRRVVEALT